MRHVHVHVTQKDIDWGIPRSGVSCPVARAIERRLLQTHPHIQAMMVLASGVSLTRRNGWISTAFANFPPRVSDWIVAFDNEGAVQPINFTFAMPEIPS